jgi:hypothetical protein
MGDEVGDRVQDERRARLLQARARVGAGQDPRDDASPGAQPGLDVAGGIADHRELLDGAAAQSHQRGQRQVRPGAAAAGVGGGQGQVDQVAPGQLGDDRVPGRRGEAGGQADPDASVAAGSEDVCGPGHGRDLACADGRLVVVLERLVGQLRGLLAAEDPPEHLDLGLAHARPHVGHGPVVRGRGQVLRRDGGGKRLHDRPVVANCGAGHVQAGDRDVGQRNVSSAIAGEQVMPRPPGPVTRTTPGSTSDRW